MSACIGVFFADVIKGTRIWKDSLESELSEDTYLVAVMRTFTNKKRTLSLVEQCLHSIAVWLWYTDLFLIWAATALTWDYFPTCHRWHLSLDSKTSLQLRWSSERLVLLFGNSGSPSNPAKSSSIRSAFANHKKLRPTTLLHRSGDILRPLSAPSNFDCATPEFGLLVLHAATTGHDPGTPVGIALRRSPLLRSILFYRPL